MNNKKLSRLLEPNLKLVFICMLLFKPAHIKEQDDKYRAAAGKEADEALAGRK